jgi:hypothetical protein
VLSGQVQELVVLRSEAIVGISRYQIDSPKDEVSDLDDVLAEELDNERDDPRPIDIDDVVNRSRPHVAIVVPRG